MLKRLLIPTFVVMMLGLGLKVLAQAPAEPAAETLTELERAKVENLQLRTAYATLLAQSDACKAEVGAAFNLVGQLRARVASEELTAQERQVRQAIEAGHPGFSWDPKTGQFTKKADVPK